MSAGDRYAVNIPCKAGARVMIATAGPVILLHATQPDPAPAAGQLGVSETLLVIDAETAGQLADALIGALTQAQAWRMPGPRNVASVMADLGDMPDVEIPAVLRREA